MIAILVAESFFLLQTYNNYNESKTQIQILNTQYQISVNEKTTLQNNYDDLENSYFDMQNAYTDIQNAYSDIQNSYYTLNELHQDLSQEKQQLETDYNSLVDDYNVLSLDYTIESCLRIGNSLESYYDYLRQELGPTGTENWWRQPDANYWQTSVDFAANLALHDIRRINWPAIENDYYNAIGEYSYDTAFMKIHEVLDFIDIRTYDSATIKIRKILAFVNKYIHYEVEVNDVFLAPVETLGFKSGDCDDFSILVAALFDEVCYQILFC